MPTHYNGPAAQVQALDAYIKLMRASGSLGTRLTRELVRSGLTESQFGVLEILHHLGPLHQCQIAGKLLKSGANITTVIDNLERNGLVSRQIDPDDRRSTFVALTPEGARQIAEIFPVQAALITDAMSSLTPEEQIELGTLCRKLGRAAVDN